MQRFQRLTGQNLQPDQRTGGLGSKYLVQTLLKTILCQLVMTREASEVGIYIASSGQQAAMIGFMVVDTGDAPESCGNAVHTISGYNAATGAQIPTLPWSKTC